MEHFTRCLNFILTQDIMRLEIQQGGKLEKIKRELRTFLQVEKVKSSQHFKQSRQPSASPRKHIKIWNIKIKSEPIWSHAQTQKTLQTFKL